MGTGNNIYGQLGIGVSIFTSYFTQIPLLNNLNNILFNRTKFIGFSSFFIQTYQEMNNSPIMNNSKLIEEIVIPIVLFILILSILFILLFLYLKRKSSKVANSSNIELKKSIEQNIEINLNELIEGSNRIYKGKYTGKEVALKKVNDNNFNELNFYQ